MSVCICGQRAHAWGRRDRRVPERAFLRTSAPAEKLSLSVRISPHWLAELTHSHSTAQVQKIALWATGYTISVCQIKRQNRLQKGFLHQVF